MRESCLYGSVRGDRGNPVPYRDNGIQGRMNLRFRGGRRGDFARWPSLGRHSWGLEIVRPMLPRRMTAALIGRVCLLMRLHQRQHRAQSFVLDDRAGLDGRWFLGGGTERQQRHLELNGQKRPSG